MIRTFFFTLILPPPFNTSMFKYSSQFINIILILQFLLLYYCFFLYYMLLFYYNVIYRLPPLPPTPPKLSSVNFAEYVVIAVRFGSFSDFTNLKMPWVRLSRDWCAGRPSLCVSEVEIQYL